MQNTILDIIFVLLLITLNLDLFLILNVNTNINIPRSPKMLKVLLLPIITFLTCLLILNPDRYLGPCFMSIALVALLAMRFFMYKILATNFEKDIELNRSIRRIFDKFVYPFFVIFISLYQCLYIFVWGD